MVLGITVKAAQLFHLPLSQCPSSPELGLNPLLRLPWQQQLSIYETVVPAKGNYELDDSFFAKCFLMMMMYKVSIQEYVCSTWHCRLFLFSVWVGEGFWLDLVQYKSSRLNRGGQSLITGSGAGTDEWREPQLGTRGPQEVTQSWML